MRFEGLGTGVLRLRVLLPVMLAASLFAQEQPTPSVLPSGPQTDAESTPAAAASAQPSEPPGGNRVFGVLPNYRTADASLEGTVLTNRAKLTIASKDSFDYPLVALAGAEVVPFEIAGVRSGAVSSGPDSRWLADIISRARRFSSVDFPLPACPVTRCFS